MMHKQVPPGRVARPSRSLSLSLSSSSYPSFTLSPFPSLSLSPSLSTVALLLAGGTASAQYYIPPDPFNDMQKETFGIWPNMGQVVSTQGIGMQQVGDADDLFLTGSCGHLPTLVNGPNWHDSAPPPTGINGVLARFSRKGVPKWITYLGHGTDHSPWCLYVNDPSGITVGGYTNDTQFEFTPWPGHYFQNVYYQDPDTAGVPRSQDCFLVRFNGEQQRIHATLFGGNAGTGREPENIVAVQDIGASTYVVGYTSKPHGQPAAYFPLAGDVNGSAYFNPLFNYNGLSDQWTDGFITEFCNELVTSIAVPVVPEGMVRAGWRTSADFMLYGLADGLHQVQVFDAQGRLVLETRTRSASGRSEGIALHGEGVALYMVVLDHERATKLAAIR